MVMRQFLVGWFADALREPNPSGLVLLHCAAMVAPLDVVRLLVEASLGALEVTTRLGLPPLHVAVRHGATTRERREVVRFLAERSPRAPSGKGRRRAASVAPCRPKQGFHGRPRVPPGSSPAGSPRKRHKRTSSAALCGRELGAERGRARRVRVAPGGPNKVPRRVAPGPRRGPCTTCCECGRTSSSERHRLVLTCIGGRAACAEDFDPRLWGRTSSIGLYRVFFFCTYYPLSEYTAARSNPLTILSLMCSTGGGELGRCFCCRTSSVGVRTRSTAVRTSRDIYFLSVSKIWYDE
jgi:hypothetical protein